MKRIGYIVDQTRNKSPFNVFPDEEWNIDCKKFELQWYQIRIDVNIELY